MQIDFRNINLGASTPFRDCGKSLRIRVGYLPTITNSLLPSMLAFDIEIDREKYVTAGVEDWSLLSLHVTASRHEDNSPVRDGYIECSVGGLTLPDGEGIRRHFRWVNAPLDVGSVLTIRVVDVPEADEPKRRYRSDSVTQENPFTDEEIRAMRYKDYLDLKAEFEPASRG